MLSRHGPGPAKRYLGESLIQEYIGTGSHIISDGWAAYGQIDAILGGGAYTHDVVIHEENFVDSTDPSFHTNSVENLRLVENPFQIGWPGLIVEIDESMISKKKNPGGPGRPVAQRWVIGGLCRHDRRSFLIGIENKRAETLLPLIQTHIAPDRLSIPTNYGAAIGSD
eukprot:maker-scaffold759_size101470-snap-gene-0.21 protein:Tk05120 transcript:maker-scaffold759_size101470-snap-gene-0.21-mRNA-1 annotation:"hypothetical protein HELRODRAFT_178721"